MKFEDLRHHRAEQGGLCESFWRALCIICRSRLFASVWPLQCLQKRGVIERLASDQAVAQKNCVIQRFHRERAVYQAGEVEEVRDRPEGEHQVVVRQRMAMSLVPMRQAARLCTRSMDSMSP